MKRLSDFSKLLLSAGVLLSFASSTIPGANAGDNIDAVPDVGTGELILGAPGVGLTYHTVVELPFQVGADIGRYFKFEFTGIEVQADADGVPGSYGYDGYMWDAAKKTNNGHGNNIDGVDASNPGESMDGEDTDPTVDDEIKDQATAEALSLEELMEINKADPVPGWWEMWGQVNDVPASSLSFTTSALHELSGVLRLVLDTPVIFREQTIELSWAGDGNSKDPDGHFYILGSAIKEPPVPFGSLKLNQTHYANGTKPPFGWAIARE